MHAAGERPAVPRSAQSCRERMLALGGVAVQRCRFPVVHPSDSTGQGSSQSFAGQAPGLILGPHEVRFLI
jgi:hypothetical protein